MGRVTARRKVWRIDLDNGTRDKVDQFAVEEPLEIRLGQETLTVTMRTPGHDVELAHGLLLGEGVIRDRDDVVAARFCTDTHLNVLEVTLRGSASVPVSAQRSLVSYGGCGLCGKSTLDAIDAVQPPELPRARVAAEVLGALPQRVRGLQRVFSSTGGVHAAALATLDGEVLVAREDIGRHNAVDKVLGWAVTQDRARDDLVLVVSSRASFEIVQKAVLGGIGVLACISAPSSLAIEAADRFGLTLVAFARGRTMTVCTHPERVTT